MSEAVVHPPNRHDDELRQMGLQRYREAEEAGLTHQQACEFAFSEEDVGILRRLVKDGCPPKLIWRIVRP